MIESQLLVTPTISAVHGNVGSKVWSSDSICSVYLSFSSNMAEKALRDRNTQKNVYTPYFMKRKKLLFLISYSTKSFAANASDILFVILS